MFKTKKINFCFSFIFLLLLFSFFSNATCITTFASNAISFITLKNNTAQIPVSVDSYGAIGDGIHDDSVAIQKAFDNNEYVSFTPGKTYKLISNGLYIKNDLVIEGNNSTILIDDSYNPTKSDFSKHVIRHAYNSHSNYLEISHLNIEVKVTQNNYSGNDGKNYLCVLQPTYVDNIYLQDTNITVWPSKNKIINLWLDQGCNSFIMENSALKNYTTYREGGVLWFMSSDDKLFNKYTAYKNIEVSNCILAGTCGDELLAIYGTQSTNAIFEKCTIIGNNQSPNTTRPLSVFSNGKNAEFDVTFNECIMACIYNTAIENCAYDSFIGIGSDSSNNHFDVAFNNCSINASVQNCLLYPSIIQKNITAINTYSINNPTIEINFSSCDIICDRPIAGCSSKLFIESRDLIALNFNMKHCNVICSNSLAVLTPIWTNGTFYYYTPTIKLINNVIMINDCTALLVSKYLNLDINLTNQNNTLLNENILSTSYINNNTISYITQS